MANKEALRELQSRLAARLSAARSQERATSWLAVECARQGFLLPLEQAGEIFALVPLVGVPHTHDWFLGVANLRGGVYGVVDLARFVGLAREPAEAQRDEARLVVFNPSFNLNCALLVDRLAGLRNPEQLRADSDDDTEHERPPFAGGRYRDAQGRAWQELNLAALVGDDVFMRIVG